MSEIKTVRVKILPLHNIGGIGNDGDVVTMSVADAEMYLRDGYVEMVDKKAVVVSEKKTEAHKVKKAATKKPGK